VPPHHHHPLDEHRLQRRASFNADASLYDNARPDYPEAVFDDMIELTGIPAGGTILEVGTGTGKATLPLARRGFVILGIELGDQMAAIARKKLAPYSKARVEVAAFEDRPLPSDVSFDLVFAASAWHWIDPNIGYRKAAEALRDGGSLALLWSSQRRAGGASSTGDGSDFTSVAPDLFVEAMREISGRLVPQVELPWENRTRQNGQWRYVQADAPEASGYFSTPQVRTYTWATTYDADAYLRLLDSYSSYRVLDPDQHARLFEAVRDLIENRFGGEVTRQWRAELYVARRR
jgi:SAM-dependent methyltransferase